jgi:hypothetical protein
MQRTRQDYDCRCDCRAPVALVTAAIVALVGTAIPACAQDRLNLPEITIMGSPPPPDTSHQPCADAAGSNDHSLGCLNQQMRRQVDQVNPSLNVPPIDAKSPDLKVGVVSIPGVQQQYGKNFGHSVVPFRPPPPIYSGLGAAGRR